MAHRPGRSPVLGAEPGLHRIDPRGLPLVDRTDLGRRGANGGEVLRCDRSPFTKTSRGQRIHVTQRSCNRSPGSHGSRKRLLRCDPTFALARTCGGRGTLGGGDRGVECRSGGTRAGDQLTQLLRQFGIERDIPRPIRYRQTRIDRLGGAGRQRWRILHTRTGGEKQ